MHIKQVIIAGFRSYRDQLEVAPFSSKHNVVVGRNGSGKSNFFDAIRFVLLSSRFANLRQEERQHLLHEGAGANVMSAFVEIIFDNTDGRFPVDQEEVVLRRTIGLKKDEFFLNRKHIAKSDVIHLLESAGFSRSNPYYIVQQGKVQALALMKDKERLELLKEVAGTRVYEERREESVKILVESEKKREEIQKVIVYIEERLQELEEEKAELSEYQQLDKEKRALEYTLYDKELTRAREQLQELEDARQEENEVSKDIHDRAFRIHEEIRSTEKDIKDAQQKARLMTQEREDLEMERTQLIQNKAKLELDLRELDDRVAADEERQSRTKKEATALKSQIAEAQQQLDKKINPEFNRRKATVEQIANRISELERKSEALYIKQGRNSQFSSVQERDRFLQGEIQELHDVISAKERNIQDLQKSIASLQSQIGESKENLQEQQEEMNERYGAVEALMKRSEELKQQLNGMAEERKQAWAADQAMDKEVSTSREQLKRAEDDLRSTMPREVRQGLQAIDQIVATQRIRGYHGPLINLIDLEREQFRTAVEVAAGNALFHIVVDNDEIAAKLMKALEQRNAGRLTFMPLNRLRPKRTEYPTSEDAIPLISKIKYDRQFKPAMETLFGKFLLCRDLTVASNFAESAGMDCLTLEGDLVQRRGAMQGGYNDPLKSRLAAYAAIKKTKQLLEKAETDWQKTKERAEQADMAVTKLMSERTRVESEKNQARENHVQASTSFKRLRDTIKVQEANLQEKLTQLGPLQNSLDDSRLRLQLLEKEIGSELTASLSPQEKRELEALQAELLRLKENQTEEVSALEEVRAKKTSLETLLNSNLVRRLEEAESELGAGTTGQVDVAERLDLRESKRSDLEHARNKFQENYDRMQRLEQSLQETQKFLASLNKKLEDLKNEDTALAEALQGETRKTEKVMNKRSMLLQQREDNMRKIRELGTLPMAELERFKSYSLKKVMKTLHEINEKLKKYSHVNKKALDQYVNFSEQRTALIDRKKELDDGGRAIEELIEVLDQRKDEAILRTFKGVSHHFSEVFKELVPDGHGNITIVRAKQTEESESSNVSSMGVGRVSSFEGVQVRVSFTGGAETYLMQQLSGGQKAVVALAFIFAIQRCDPAPFYLFDEIDQALDSTYRAAVAALIERQTNDKENPAQFITSTFRPELVNAADKFYGIGHQNKVSNVHEMSKDEALDFIRSIMAEEEAVGPITNRRTSVATAQPA